MVEINGSKPLFGGNWVINAWLTQPEVDKSCSETLKTRHWNKKKLILEKQNKTKQNKTKQKNLPGLPRDVQGDVVKPILRCHATSLTCSVSLRLLKFGYSLEAKPKLWLI